MKATAATGAVLAAPTIIPATALGKDGAVAPSNRITMGCVGIGWQGTTNMKNFMKEDDCQVVAVCDVDRFHLATAANLVNAKYGNNDVATYTDFREVMQRDDIDTVLLALPDHWHAVPAIVAANSGKDIFGEKPFSHTHAEGVAMVNAVHRNKRIWQTGSWQRSDWNFRLACELVRNRAIGKITRVEVGIGEGFADYTNTKDQDQPIKPPYHLDYDMWCGPAPKLPYIPARHHKNWRWALDYGGGKLMDWVGHHVDIAHWGLDLDNSGPTAVWGQGEYPPRDAVWNAAPTFKVECEYADDLHMTIASSSKQPKGQPIDHSKHLSGTKWYGEDGQWIYVDRGRFESNPDNLAKEITRLDKRRDPLEANPGETRLFKSPGHWRNFLDSVKSRETTLTPAETAHRSATPGHLGHIAMTLGRKIQFDPKTEKIIGDAEATKMLGKEYRGPWSLHDLA
jgi:predicted dehydrogenase